MLSVIREFFFQNLERHICNSPLFPGAKHTAASPLAKDIVQQVRSQATLNPHLIKTVRAAHQREDGFRPHIQDHPTTGARLLISRLGDLRHHLILAAGLPILQASYPQQC